MMADDAAYMGGRNDFRGGRGGASGGARGRGGGGLQPRYKGDRQMSRSRSQSGSPAYHRRNQRGAYRQSRGGAASFAGRDRQGSLNNNGNNNNPEKEQQLDNSEAPEPRQQNLTIQRRSIQQPEESSNAPPAFAIHISNLPFSVDKDQLRGAFKEFGRVLHSSVILDERGQSRGLGLIEYDTREAAENAAVAMDKAMFNGREVAVIFTE